MRIIKYCVFGSLAVFSMVCLKISYCDVFDSKKEEFSLYEEAKKYEKEKNLKKAIELYQKAYEISQDIGFKRTMLELIGELYIRMKKYKDAKEIYQKLLESSSNSFEIIKAKMKIAYIYVYQKQYSEAFKILDEIIEEYPNSEFAADAQYSKASIYYSFMKEYSKAIAEYKKMIEKFPKDWRVKQEPYTFVYIASCYLELKKYDEAMAVYQEIIRKFPNTKWEKFGKANIEILNEYYKKGKKPKLEEVREIFQKFGLK